MKLAFFQGCNIPIRIEQYAVSAQAVLQKFGVELVEVPEFTCCGYPVRNVDEKAYILPSVRNMAIAEKLGHILHKNKIMGIDLPPDNDHLWYLVLGIIIAKGGKLTGIHHTEIAKRCLHSSQPRGVARLPGESELNPVWAAVIIAEKGNWAADIPPCTLGEDH